MNVYFMVDLALRSEWGSYLMVEFGSVFSEVYTVYLVYTVAVELAT